MYHAAVLTVSDRSFRGERPDKGGPLVSELLKNAEKYFSSMPEEFTRRAILRSYTDS